MSQETTPNPFDDGAHTFAVLRNDRGQYSLWPDFADVPAGWECRFGPAPRAACVDYVERHWRAIDPFGAGAA